MQRAVLELEPLRCAPGRVVEPLRVGGLRPGTKPVVVLAHMSNGSLCEWLPEARRLAARGIWVFAFDFRGHGFSQGTQRYGRLGLDVAAAVKAARGLGARKVVVAGASLGGIAVVVAGATRTASAASRARSVNVDRIDWHADVTAMTCQG